MRPITLDIDPANANLTGFGSNVTGATFTLTANSSGDSLAHQVSIKNDSATDHSGKTVTLVGTDADGHAQTEVVTGPGASATVESSKYFLTLTSATPSATIGSDTFDIGWVDEIATKTIPLDYVQAEAPLISINVTGTISIDVQLTANDPQRFGDTSSKVATALQIADQEAALWIDDDNLAALTADAHGEISDWPVRALRLITNSYTDGAEAQIEIVSPRQ